MSSPNAHDPSSFNRPNEKEIEMTDYLRDIRKFAKSTDRFGTITIWLAVITTLSSLASLYFSVQALRPSQLEVQNNELLKMQLLRLTETTKKEETIMQLLQAMQLQPKEK